jgi:hypothetical protein
MSARLEFLSDSNSRRAGSGFSYILVDGYTNTFVLDQMDMNHVILRNVHVQYDGGPILLSDVYFVNCSFNSKFRFTGDSVALGKEILKGPSASYSNKGK